MLTKLGSLTQQDVLVPLVMLLLIYVTINSNICQKAPESTSLNYFYIIRYQKQLPCNCQSNGK